MVTNPTLSSPGSSSERASVTSFVRPVLTPPILSRSTLTHLSSYATVHSPLLRPLQRCIPACLVALCEGLPSPRLLLLRPGRLHVAPRPSGSREITSSVYWPSSQSLRSSACFIWQICTHRPTQIVSVLESLHLLLRSLADAPAPYAGLGSPWSDGGATDGAGAVRTLFGWTRATVDALVSGEANDAAELGRASSPRSILVNWRSVAISVGPFFCLKGLLTSPSSLCPLSLITSQIVRDLVRSPTPRSSTLARLSRTHALLHFYGTGTPLGLLPADLPASQGRPR